MRRLTMALALTAMTLVGTLWPPPLPASASTPAGISHGDVAVNVTTNAYGYPVWTATFAGEITAGGQTYSGSATGTGSGGRNLSRFEMDPFTGSSSTGTLTGFCSGYFVDRGGEVAIAEPSVMADTNFTGVIDFGCELSINGGLYSTVDLIVGLLPTGDPHVFKGLYTGSAVPPDTAGLPRVPLVGGGIAGAGTDSGFGVDPSMSFEYVGQISLGGREFQGRAAGGVGVQPARSVAVPPFALTSQEAGDTLSATCSGQWRSTDIGLGVAVALSVLSCNGSVNGGPSGTTTLVSVYAETSTSVRPGETGAAYTGVFAGL